MLPHDDLGDGPAVVLLHAGIADRTMWAEHLQPLADAGHRVIAVDLPGFGQAPPAERVQAPWADVLQTMDELGVARAALIGNSFGGAVALRMAVVAPERVGALGLVSAPPHTGEPSERLRAAWAAEEEALDRGDLEAAVEAVLDAWLQPGAPEALRERIAAMQRRAFARQADAPDVPEAPDPVDEHPDAVAGLTMPALAAAGAHDLPDFVRGAELLAATLPHATHAVIEGAGHLAPLEAPEAFRELALALLRRMPPQSASVM